MIDKIGISGDLAHRREPCRAGRILATRDGGKSRLEFHRNRPGPPRSNLAVVDLAPRGHLCRRPGHASRVMPARIDVCGVVLTRPPRTMKIFSPLHSATYPSTSSIIASSYPPRRASTAARIELT